MKVHPWCWAVRDCNNDSVIQLSEPAASDSQKMREHPQPGLSDTLKGAMPYLKHSLLFHSLLFSPDILVYWWKYSGSASKGWVGILSRRLYFFSTVSWVGQKASGDYQLFLTRLCSSILWSHCRQWNIAKFYNFRQKFSKLVCLYFHLQHGVLKFFDSSALDRELRVLDYMIKG